MKILVINAGSSSLKYQLIEMSNETAIAKGIVERIGISNSFYTIKTEKGEHRVEKDITSHAEGIQAVMSILVDKKHGCISDMSQINAVGHRVVHSGEDFATSVRINPQVLKAIASNTDLAPLHMPPNIAGIEACLKVMSNAPAVAVFDTSFHSTLPQYAFMYALPYEAYTQYKVRKYGFHGTSHLFVSQEARKLWGKDKSFRLVVCHLGNGASISAVRDDVCIDTSMGFTPLDGLIMGTRSGDIDPAVIEFLAKKKSMTIAETMEYLNRKSGVLGISGVSSDFRDLLASMESGHERATLAVKMFCYRISKYIGSYAAALGGIDMLAFTAGIGENTPEVRQGICEGLEFLGIKLDDSINKGAKRGHVVDISHKDAKVKSYIIPTNEELVIARETIKFGFE